MPRSTPIRRSTLSHPVLAVFTALHLPSGTQALALQKGPTGASDDAVLAPRHRRSAQTHAGTPRLFFLFMAMQELPNEQLWMNFLEGADPDTEYAAFVHCVNSTQCTKNIQHKETFNLIPTVHSEWCFDLVSPMDALLDAALAHGTGHAGDKFIYISDTTAPVKPFCEVRSILLSQSDTQSNFCIPSQGWWAWYRERDIAVKHHQWLTLSRQHAAKIVARRHDERDLLQHMTPLHWLGTMHVAPVIHRTVSKMGLPHVPFAQGCLDEYLYFALIFGFLNRTAYTAGSLNVDITGGPLLTQGHASEDLQGRCDTFATFGNDGSNFTTLVRQFKTDPDTKLAAAEWGMWGTIHPVHFLQLSEMSLRALRESPFLFARKIDPATNYSGNLSLLQAFNQHVFNDGGCQRRQH